MVHNCHLASLLDLEKKITRFDIKLHPNYNYDNSNDLTKSIFAA